METYYTYHVDTAANCFLPLISARLDLTPRRVARVSWRTVTARTTNDCLREPRQAYSMFPSFSPTLVLLFFLVQRLSTSFIPGWVLFSAAYHHRTSALLAPGCGIHTNVLPRLNSTRTPSLSWVATVPVTSGGNRPVGSGYSLALDLPPGPQHRPHRLTRRRGLPPPLG